MTLSVVLTSLGPLRDLLLVDFGAYERLLSELTRICNPAVPRKAVTGDTGDPRQGDSYIEVKPPSSILVVRVCDLLLHYSVPDRFEIPWECHLYSVSCPDSLLLSDTASWYHKVQPRFHHILPISFIRPIT